MNRLFASALPRNLFCAASSAVMLSALLLPALPVRAQNASHTLVAAPLTLDRKTVIPGKTLNPGSYTIQIVDLLKDRFIVQLDDAQGGSLATFIGLHNPDFDLIAASAQRGPIFWNEAPKGTAALRAFSFPNGNTLEFVYPKNEAVALAKLNTYSVPAIDPESEGRKPDPKLSKEDREVVTLWMLTATRVGPKDETPAIEAKRFVAPVEPAAATAAPVQIAEATAPPSPQPGRANAGPAPAPKVAAPEAPRVHTAVKRLPQTASNLPLFLLLSLLLFAAAGGLRLARTRA